MTGRRVAVLGLGLIGASLGAALRNKGDVVRGLDRDRASMDFALGAGLVDELADDLPSLVEDATTIVLAIPVLSIVHVLPEVDALAPPEAIIMDVGSVKAPIVAAMDALSRPGRAVGGHPIAGKEEAGPAAADSSLFEERTFVLVPGAATEYRTVRAAHALVSDVGGVPVVLTAQEHDRIVARTSHLPQLLSMALALSLQAEDAALAGPGLRDMTRLAASGADMWSDILVANAAHISAALEGCIAQLQSLAEAGSHHDGEALRRLMLGANERSSWIAGAIQT